MIGRGTLENFGTIVAELQELQLFLEYIDEGSTIAICCTHENSEEASYSTSDTLALASIKKPIKKWVKARLDGLEHELAELGGEFDKAKNHLD